MLATKRVRQNRYKRKRERRRTLFKTAMKVCLKAGAGAAFLGVASFIYIFSYDLITQCDYFKAERIRVTGVNRLSEAELLRQVGIDPGVNILSVNLATVRKLLLAQPWVAQAQASRQLPDGITISITEREPLGIVDLGRKFIIDASGDIFKEWKASDPVELPVITGLRYSDINAPGETRGRPLDAVITLLTLSKAPGNGLPHPFAARVHVDKEIGLTLHLPGAESGTVKVVKLGYDAYPDKLRRLNAIFLYAGKDRRIPDFDVIDLNNIDRIVISPAGKTYPVRSPKEV